MRLSKLDAWLVADARSGCLFSQPVNALPMEEDV